MNGRGRPTFADAGPPPPVLPSSLRSSLSSPPPPLGPSAEGGSLPPLDPGAEGGSLPPGQGILPRFITASLPLPVARDPLPDSRGRPRLPLVAAAPPAASPDSDEVPPGVARVAPGCVRRTSERPGVVKSLSLGGWRFSMATKAAFPSFTYPLTRGSPSDAGASPPGGVVPATGSKGSASPGQGAPSLPPLLPWLPSNEGDTLPAGLGNVAAVIIAEVVLGLAWGIPTCPASAASLPPSA